MSSKNISSIDEKGRVLIPQSLREQVSLAAGEKVLLSVDAASKMIFIEPAHEKKLLSLSVELADKPGALAKAALALYDINVDLVSTRSRSSKRGESAVWMVECNPQGASIAQIKTALAKAGAKIATAKWE